jgi:hypothetical protein
VKAARRRASTTLHRRRDEMVTVVLAVLAVPVGLVQGPEARALGPRAKGAILLPRRAAERVALVHTPTVRRRVVLVLAGPDRIVVPVVQA